MKLVIHTDGGSRGNPGPSATGVVVDDVSGTHIASLSTYLGITTNNQAEYKAVIEALTWLASFPTPLESVAFILDSQLVVSQINGLWAVKEAGMRELKSTVDRLRASLPYRLTFEHTLRADNKAADALVNQTLDSQA